MKNTELDAKEVSRLPSDTRPLWIREDDKIYNTYEHQHDTTITVKTARDLRQTVGTPRQAGWEISEN